MASGWSHLLSRRFGTMIRKPAKAKVGQNRRAVALMLERLEDRLVPATDILWVGTRAFDLVLAQGTLDVNITQISGATFAQDLPQHDLANFEILYVDDTAGEDNAAARSADIAAFVTAGGVLLTDNGGNPKPDPSDSNFDWVPNAADIDVISGADKDTITRTAAGQTHPITAEFTNAELSNWEDSETTQFTGFIGMTALTRDEDNRAGILVGTFGAGTLIYFGQHLAHSDPAFSNSDDPADEITAAELLFNAFEFAISTLDNQPNAVDDSATTDEDTAATINVLGNDTGISDIPLEVTTTQPAHGTALVNGSNQIVYTPALNFNGTDTFQYTVTDEDGDSDTATVTVTVTAVDDVDPVAVNDTASTADDTPVDIDVLANDNAGVDGPPAIFSFVTPTAQGGSVTPNPDGTLKYTPPAGFIGTDSFSYVMVDSDGEQAGATVTVTVTAVDAVNDNVSTNEDTPLASIDVLANDDLGDDPPTNVSDFDDTGTLGTVVQNGNTFTYTPPVNFHGSDSFTYTIQDSDGHSDTATVTITVDPVDDGPPVANDDSVVTDEDDDVVIAVLPNDVIVDAPGSVTVAPGDEPAHGSVVVNPDNTITYTPNLNFHGTDTFTYTLTDFDGDTDTAVVTVTIDSVIDPGEPVIALPDPRDQTNKLGQDVTLPITITDSDSNIDTVDVSGLPPELDFSFNGLTGTLTISGTIAADAIQPGNEPYQVTVTVTDLDGHLAVETFTWTITRDAIGVFSRATAVWTVDDDYSNTPPGDTAMTSDGVPGGFIKPIAITGDWDGDNIGDIGLFRKGTWILDRNGDGNLANDNPESFGGYVFKKGDKPVVGDWDGDGDDDFGIYRKGRWLLDLDGNGTLTPGLLANGGEKVVFKANVPVLPVVGDWDGDGDDNIGLYFKQTGKWILDSNSNFLNSVANGDERIAKFGGPGRRPVVGDWDGDGDGDVGFFRRKPNKTTVWMLDFNGNRALDQSDRDARILNYGTGGPVVANWEPR